MLTLESILQYLRTGFGSTALKMFYRLVQGGICPLWYGIHGPVTYFLQPGLLQDEEQQASWNKIFRGTRRTAMMSDKEFGDKVIDRLQTIYTRRSMGFSIYADHTTAGEHGFATLGRFVDVGDFPRQPADRIILDWQMTARAQLTGAPLAVERSPPRTHTQSTPRPKRSSAQNNRANLVQTGIVDDSVLGTPVRPRPRRRPSA